MSDYPLVRFVDSPSWSAAVRFDFNDGAVWAEHDAFDLGVPSLEGDPDGVGAEYGFRSLSFTIAVEGEKRDALGKQSALARELLRRDNWLMFQLDAGSAPVWFKTYRTEPGALSFDHVYVEGHDLWEIGVSLTADPFAYGERVTLPTVTIKNDPAAATNPVSYVLPEIQGDAPAPMVMTGFPSVTRMESRIMAAVSATENGTYTAPIVWQVGSGDSWTAGTDTGAAVSSTSFSGGSYRPVTFATNAAMAQRLASVALPNINAGRYKVLVRVARSDTSSTFALRLRQFTGSTSGDEAGRTVRMDRAASTAAGHATWLDLGDFSWPRAVMTRQLAKPPATSPTVALDAQRLSGSGELRIDCFLVVPIALVNQAETTTLFATVPSLQATTTPQAIPPTVNGEDEFVYVQHDRRVPGLEGGFPLLHPGLTNTLHLLLQTQPSTPSSDPDAGVLDNSDDITQSFAATISYLPRYLYLAGS